MNAYKYTKATEVILYPNNAFIYQTCWYFLVKIIPSVHFVDNVAQFEYNSMIS